MPLDTEIRTAPPVGKAFFIGVDSDGCVFDTMELKQKECFIPLVVRCFGLQAVSRFARETAEFVNLHSSWRGTNRFVALLATLDLLRERPEVGLRSVAVPRLEGLRTWLREESSLGNPALERRVRASGDPDLARVLEWSLAVNCAVADMVRPMEPFPGVRNALERAGAHADLVVVSQTPAEALEREWRENGMRPLVGSICGQEVGPKADQIRQSSAGRHPGHRMLMVGDAPGDLRAAREAGSCFFPINPGSESASWEELGGEGLDRFFDHRFAGAYEDALADRFERLLPDTPPWAKASPSTSPLPEALRP